MPQRTVLDVEGLAHKNPIPNAVRMGNIIVSGSISGIDRHAGTYPEDIREEVANAFANTNAILEAGGAGLEHIAKLDVYLRDKADREHLNEQWVQWFPSPSDRPARHTTEQALPGSMRIQMSVLAVIDT